ncbi:MAG: OB-fold nucleic acid binding domain-containing protein [Ilumatobacteraceae bacterium]
MGLRDAFRAKGVRQLDSERLVDRFTEQIEKYGVTKITDLEPRNRVRVCGEVKRMTIKPRSGIPSTEITINDGTGQVVVVFSGRRHVAGIEHGKCLRIEGVAFSDKNDLVFLNPAYTLLP